MALEPSAAALEKATSLAEANPVVPPSEEPLIDYAALYRQANSHHEMPPANDTEAETHFDISDADITPKDEKVDGPHYRPTVADFAASAREGIQNASTWVGEKSSEVISEQVAKVRGFLTKNNLDTFEGLTGHGKRIAAEAFGRAVEATGADRLTAIAGVLWHNRWADFHRGTLKNITEKTSAEVTGITTEISAATKNRDASRQAIELLSTISSEQADAFQVDIDRQEDRIVGLTLNLAIASQKQAEAIKQQQEKIAATEDAALAIGSRFIEKVSARLEPIKSGEQEAEAALGVFLETNEKAELTRQEKEAELTELTKKIDQLRLLQTSGNFNDGKTISAFNRTIEKLVHDTTVARETLEQARENAEMEKLQLVQRLRDLKAKKVPFQQKVAFFENRAQTVKNRRNAPPIVPLETAAAASLEEADEIEVRPDTVENAEKEQTIGEFIDGWNVYAQTITPSSDRDHNLFIIDKKSFVDDARTPGFHASTTIEPNKMIGHIVGRLQRQIRASRGARFAIELEKKAETAVQTFFAAANKK